MTLTDSTLRLLHTLGIQTKYLVNGIHSCEYAYGAVLHRCCLYTICLPDWIRAGGIPVWGTGWPRWACCRCTLVWSKVLMQNGNTRMHIHCDNNTAQNTNKWQLGRVADDTAITEDELAQTKTFTEPNKGKQTYKHKLPISWQNLTFNCRCAISNGSISWWWQFHRQLNAPIYSGSHKIGPVIKGCNEAEYKFAWMQKRQIAATNKIPWHFAEILWEMTNVKTRICRGEQTIWLNEHKLKSDHVCLNLPRTIVQTLCALVEKKKATVANARILTIRSLLDQLYVPAFGPPSGYSTRTTSSAPTRDNGRHIGTMNGDLAKWLSNGIPIGVIYVSGRDLMLTMIEMKLPAAKMGHKCRAPNSEETAVATQLIRRTTLRRHWARTVCVSPPSALSPPVTGFIRALTCFSCCRRPSNKITDKPWLIDSSKSRCHKCIKNCFLLQARVYDHCQESAKNFAAC